MLTRRKENEWEEKTKVFFGGGMVLKLSVLGVLGVLNPMHT